MRRVAHFVLVAVLGVALGCGSVAPPSASFTGTAGASDAPCSPLGDNEGCNAGDRMLCEQTSSTWQVLEECAASQNCQETDDPALPGAKLSKCVAKPTPDTQGAADGGASVGVCERWSQDRVDMAEGDWDGSAPKCDPGTLETRAVEQATRLVNLYRFLAGLPEVGNTAELNANAQACAVMMRANGKISHTPPSSWKCWSEVGALAAKKSNLSTTGVVKSVDRYMIDSGSHNQATLGHRRWILNNKLDNIGAGSAGSKFSCLWVIGGKAKANKPWAAWPPPGDVPFAAISPYGTSLDTTGWSVQSDTIAVQKTTVKVTVDGVDKPIKQRTLKANYGSKYAVAWRPDGWETTAGVTYHVVLEGASPPIEYDVSVLDCGL